MNMDMVEKLNYLMRKHSIKNITVLAENAEVPYTTLISIFNRDTMDIRLSTAKKLCDFFNITLDQLLNDEVLLPDFQDDVHIAASSDNVDLSGLNDFTKSIIIKMVSDFKNENKN